MNQLLDKYRPLLISALVLTVSCVVTVGAMSRAIEQSISREKVEELVQAGEELARMLVELKQATDACKDFLIAESKANVTFEHMVTQAGAFCQQGIPLDTGWVVIGQKHSDGSHTRIYDSRRGSEIQRLRAPADSQAIIGIDALYERSLRDDESVLSEPFEDPATGAPVITTLAALPRDKEFYVSLAFDPTDIARDYLLYFDGYFKAFALEVPNEHWVLTENWSSELKRALSEMSEHEHVLYGDHSLHHVSGRDENDWARVLHLEGGWSLGGVVINPNMLDVFRRGWQPTISLIVFQVLVFACFAFWFVSKLRERTIYELNQQAQLIIHADAQKASIIKSMAHEIRSPIIRLIGALELAQISKRGDDDSLSASLSSANTVLQLCDDLLDLGQLGSGDYKSAVSSFDIEGMLAEVKNEYTQFAKDQKTQLTVQFEGDSAIIQSDRLRIRQLISNLLHNALRATHGGSVSVVTSVSAKKSDSAAKSYLKIVVSDTGIGMPPDVLSKVFDEFVTYSKNGTGLGLAVVKRIVQRLNGKVEAESSPGVGSVFTVTLPLLMQEKAIVATSSKNALLNYSVLLVEDEDIIRKVTVRKLLEAGAKVSTASDGEEAVIMCRSLKFDVIFMDLEMPNLSGLEASREIRAAGLNVDVPIFGLTSHLRKHRWESAAEAGMSELFTKPIEIPVIATFLREVEKGSVGCLSSTEISECKEILDLTVFAETCCLSKDGYNMELVNGFVSQALSFKNELASVDTDDLPRVVHGFKGISMIFGASLLTEKLFLFEESFKDGSMGGAAEMSLRKGISECVDETIDAMVGLAQVAS